MKAIRPNASLAVVLSALGTGILLAGCHGRGTGGGIAGGGTIPLTLTFHDTPTSGVVVTSFQATVTGAVLQPGNVSLLAANQTIEFTQLQTNSSFLSTTNVAAGNYTSLKVTYSNPQYTILNNTGATLTIGTTTCGANKSCVITPTVSGTLTNTISTAPFPIVLSSSSQALLEVDVNLNNIVQADFSVNFGASGAVTANVLQSPSSTAVIGSLALNGEITAVGTTPNQFSFAASTGQTFSNIAVTSNTQFAQFNQSARGLNCTANDFTCLAANQIVDVQLQVRGDGTFQAAEVDFDDAGTTQQVSGTIVALIGSSPPTGFQMVVHNTVPALASLPVGTPVTVTISTTPSPSFLINDGLFALPSGSFNFASAGDFLVGQEVEARVSGTVTAGSPPSFTADRFALEQTQFNGTVISVSSPNFFVNFTSLPTIFVSPVTQIQVVTSSQTTFQTQPSASFSDMSSLVSKQGGVIVGGFLFNSSNPQTPNVVGVTVRGQVPGT
ncbi:MAG TPA: hypothetical protein VJN21_01770 [Candidatus Acidoferrales bacterium]|nr:hypothetical protein [Candidatus Acidoferrales bacterium]